MRKFIIASMLTLTLAPLALIWLADGGPAPLLRTAPLDRLMDKATAGLRLTGKEITRSPSRIRPLALTDRLTCLSLDLAIRVESPGAEPQDLIPGEACDLSGMPAESWVSYSIAPDEPLQRVRLADCLAESDSCWQLDLPFACAIELSLLGAVPRSAEQTARVSLLRIQVPAPAASAEEDPYTAFAFPEAEMTEAGLLLWHLRTGRAEPLYEQIFRLEESPILTVPGMGSSLLWVVLEDGSSGVARIEAQPGLQIRVNVPLHERPLLCGRLLDWEGNPVAAGKVVLTVALDLADYDFRPDDPHGFVAYRRDGVMHHSVKRTYKTDHEGRFAITVPRGRSYALYSHALDGYVFWSGDAEAAVASHGTPIEIRLAQKFSENEARVTLLKPDGSPLDAAKVTVTVAGDVPYFRQWPGTLATDVEGQLSVLGLEPGMQIGLMVRHEALKGGMYAPAYPKVPADRRIVIQVPWEALRGLGEVMRPGN